MRPTCFPSGEVLRRASEFSFTREKEQSKFILGPRRMMGLLIDIPFEPIQYLGTTSFTRGKINKNIYYEFSLSGPWYSGESLKTALRILGTNRVRFFTHRKENQNEIVLLLGTDEGTVAIAPRMEKPEVGSYRKLIDIMRFPTSKLRRALVYAGI